LVRINGEQVTPLRLLVTGEWDSVIASYEKTSRWIGRTSCDIKRALSGDVSIFFVANSRLNIQAQVYMSEICSSCGNEVPRPSQLCPHCGQGGRFWNVLDANKPDERAALTRRYDKGKKMRAIVMSTPCFKSLKILLLVLSL